MVFFVCETCNETLKKNQVEKHSFRCRNCAGVTCVDCSQTFSIDDYAKHTSCISEAEKYEKTLYKGKVQTKVNPQDIWMSLINEAASRKTEASPAVAPILQKLTELDNVPRNKNKFLNFAKNSLRLNSLIVLEDVWKFIEKLKAEKDSSKPTITNQEKTAKVSMKSEIIQTTTNASHREADNTVDSAIEVDVTHSTPVVTDDDELKRESKKAKKLAKQKLRESQVESGESSHKEDDNTLNNTIGLDVTNSKPPVIIDEDELKRERKKAKKLAKQNKLLAESISVDESTIDVIGNNNLSEIKKKRKKDDRSDDVTINVKGGDITNIDGDDVDGSVIIAADEVGDVIHNHDKLKRKKKKINDA